MANGIRGIPRVIPSRTPQHFSEIVSGTAQGAVTLNAQAFLPDGADGPVPMVLLVPGSTGINTSHLKHAATLTCAGIGACVVDSFGARGITHTYHDQRLLTYSAGTYDVPAAARTLMDWDAVDSARIGAMGPAAAVPPCCSSDAAAGRRGPGPTKWIARRAADVPQWGVPVLPARRCDPHRHRDGRCRPLDPALHRAQGYAQAIRLSGGDVRVTVWPGAAHSFDREDVPITYVEQGVESTLAPVYYLSDLGYFCDSNGENEDYALTESALRDRIHQQYGRQGCWLGSAPASLRLSRSFLLNSSVRRSS